MVKSRYALKRVGLLLTERTRVTARRDCQRSVSARVLSRVAVDLSPLRTIVPSSRAAGGSLHHYLRVYKLNSLQATRCTPSTLALTVLNARLDADIQLTPDSTERAARLLLMRIIFSAVKMYENKYIDVATAIIGCEDTTGSLSLRYLFSSSSR